FIRFSRAQGRDHLWPIPRTYLAATKTNILVLENHATKPSEIALQESKGYPPKTWPTFHRSKQIIYDLPVRFLTNAFIDNISSTNHYRSRLTLPLFSPEHS